MTNRSRIFDSLQVSDFCAIRPENFTNVRKTLLKSAVLRSRSRIFYSRFARGETLTSPADTKRFLQLKLSHLEHEVFAVLWLDNRHRVLAFEELFRGTIDGASVHPREVVKSALTHNAAACILAHNHPSGIAEPSQADQRITQRLQEALGLVEVRTLDHIVVAENTCSFAGRGLL